MSKLTLTDTITLNNGVKMPRIGLGVWKTSPEAAAESIKTAIKLGYPMIDAAKQYGNEVGVGRGINEGLAEAGRSRDSLFVTTKIFNGDQGYKTTLDAFAESLKVMQLEYVDLLLIHWPKPGKSIETWQALEHIQSAGLARAIGISNFDHPYLDELLDSATVIPQVNQVEIQPYFQQNELRKFLTSKQIQAEAWSPLGGGELLQDATLQQIGAKHNKSAAQVILRWDLQKEIITIPKSVHPERIKQNIDVFDFELTPEEMALINGLDRGKRTGPWLEAFPWFNPDAAPDTVSTWD